MPASFKKSIEWFIPEHLRDNPFIHRKALVLVYANIFLTVCAFIIWCLSLHDNYGYYNHLIYGILAGFIQILFFKKIGNLKLSGNIMAFFLCIIFLSAVPQTGGIYSDNLQWMILTPIAALIFSGKNSGLFWLTTILLLFILIYLNQGKMVGLSYAMRVDPSYFLSSYSAFVIILFVIISIFETGQINIIGMLEKQRDLLTQQKMEIALKNEELEKIETKLKEKNVELENFAYAASHDLKEPLRMVSMYTQLTQKKIDAFLNDSTREYMGYVTEGTHRMQKMLDDLLHYSRMGRGETDTKSLDLNDTLFIVIHNLSATLRDTEASIIAENLPTISGNSTEMIQLFQNLIANSMKFRNQDITPIIKISVRERLNFYAFSFQDNGIGIKPEFQERVFKIFERLHARHEYDGSGIGLATCRKIVNSMGGKIWVTSHVGQGATFHFIIPKTRTVVTELKAAEHRSVA
jgi:signal transduction histidine kinase